MDMHDYKSDGEVIPNVIRSRPRRMICVKPDEKTGLKAPYSCFIVVGDMIDKDGDMASLVSAPLTGVVPVEGTEDVIITTVPGERFRIKGCGHEFVPQMIEQMETDHATWAEIIAGGEDACERAMVETFGKDHETKPEVDMSEEAERIHRDFRKEMVDDDDDPKSKLLKKLMDAIGDEDSMRALAKKIRDGIKSGAIKPMKPGGTKTNRDSGKHYH